MSSRVKALSTHRLWQGKTLFTNPSAPSCAYSLVADIARMEGTKGG